MPFSPERTELIKARIAERLASGQSNEWEEAFLKDMIVRFNRCGTKTRLSDAQFKALHRVLKLGREGRNTAPKPQTDRGGKATTPRAPRPYRSKAPPMSIARAVTAPRRAVRRAQRQVMLPIVLALGLFALVGSFFDSAPSGSTAYRPQVTSTPQASNVGVVYVTGSRVNQREGPSTSNGVMGVLTEGTRVQAIGQQGNWTQIVSPLGTGWMASNLLSSRGSTVAQSPPQGRALRTSDVRVIDGDTVDIRGQDANVRLVGFNAPETWRPSCNAELEAGRRATARLGQLVLGARSIEFKRVACSCRAGTEGTDKCNFGRQCGSLFVDGVDVGTTLMGEGLAVAYRCGRTSCPPRPKAWCR
jgi:endonuclease YncB( thermonuclease family)